CMQSEESARRIIEIGASRERVSVTGSLKFDSLEIPGASVPGRGGTRVVGGLRQRLSVTASLKFDALEIPGASVPDRGRNRVLRYFRIPPERPVIISATAGEHTCD